MFEFVDFAVGSGGGVDYAPRGGTEGLDLEFFGLEDDGCFAVGGDAVDAGGCSSGDVDVARVVGGHGPDVGGGSGIEAVESGGEFEAAHAADGYSGGSAFSEFLKFRLLPGAGAFGAGCWG